MNGAVAIAKPGDGHPLRQSASCSVRDAKLLKDEVAAPALPNRKEADIDVPSGAKRLSMASRFTL